MQQKYDLLSGAQEQEYGRYQDALAAWQKEADQLWRAYTDARDTDYRTYRDEIADWQWQREFDENQRRYDQQWAASQPVTTDTKTVYVTAKKKKEEETKKSGSFLGALAGAVGAMTGALSRR